MNLYTNKSLDAIHAHECVLLRAMGCGVLGVVASILTKTKLISGLKWGSCIYGKED